MELVGQKLNDLNTDKLLVVSQAGNTTLAIGGDESPPYSSEQQKNGQQANLLEHGLLDQI